MSKDTVIRVFVFSILALYIAPVVLMFFESSRLWIIAMQHGESHAGPISQQFVGLMAVPAGPFALLQKGMSFLATGAIIATLWSDQDRVLDIGLLALLAIGITSSLWVWFVLTIHDVESVVWQDASVAGVINTETFDKVRDPFFTTEVQTLLSLGLALTGIQIKKATTP